MPAEIKSGSSTDKADVTTNKALKVALAETVALAGYAVIAGEIHDGSGGVSALRRTARVSTDNRLRVGVDTPLWTDTFNHGQMNLSKYQVNTTTMTVPLTGGVMSFNNGLSTASGAVAKVQTYETFPIFGASAIEKLWRVRFSQTKQANNVNEVGFGLCSGTTAPTDGVYFRLDATLGLIGCARYGTNSEIVTDTLLASPVPGQFYEIKMIIDQNRVEFFVEGVLKGVLDDANGATPTLSQARSLPMFMRSYNSGVTSVAQKMEIADTAITARDVTLGKSFQTIKVMMGDGGVSLPDGVAAVQAANYTNSAAPASATLSNTAAGYAVPDGQFQFAAPLGAETDYDLFAYQVPAPALGAGNKNMLIQSITIDTCNFGAAVATTATLLQWGFAVGSTGVSLATADSGSAGTRGPRRKTIGFQTFPVGAAIGSKAERLRLDFKGGMLVEAGTFLQVFVKVPIGTATASQIIRGTVNVEYIWV